jgi:hypothetical protein
MAYHQKKFNKKTFLLYRNLSSCRLELSMVFYFKNQYISENNTPDNFKV